MNVQSRIMNQLTTLGLTCFSGQLNVWSSSSTIKEQSGRSYLQNLLVIPNQSSHRYHPFSVFR
ncbi:MAG: hypothetical protein J6Q86_01520 [Methanobrevibacter sp.]|nr:hypothetical protein [Methanobrevibacter sp.]